MVGGPPKPPGGLREPPYKGSAMGEVEVKALVSTGRVLVGVVLTVELLEATAPPVPLRIASTLAAGSELAYGLGAE